MSADINHSCDWCLWRHLPKDFPLTVCCWPVKLRELQTETSDVCSKAILFEFSGKCRLFWRGWGSCVKAYFLLFRNLTLTLVFFQGFSMTSKLSPLTYCVYHFKQKHVCLCVCVCYFRSRSQVLQQLPSLWLSEVLEEVKSSDPSSKLCATRRSAGIPFFVQVCEHCFPV